MISAHTCTTELLIQPQSEFGCNTTGEHIIVVSLLQSAAQAGSGIKAFLVEASLRSLHRATLPITDEADKLSPWHPAMDMSAAIAVGVSVVLGAAMSYFAWSARSLLSATSFTVVGNVCKLLTIAINVVIWDKHASPVGIVCLLFCLSAAYFYKQAPLRAEAKNENDGKELLPK